jgi:type I restriction enzyme R subunit
MLGSDYKPLLSDHDDKLVVRDQSYGNYNRPQDYLDSFNQFIKTQLNKSIALSVVVNRPKDLTREQLKEVKLLLDSEGYSEAKLQAAVRHETNQDIAATIIGHIRRAALGEPLMSFEQRVTLAMSRIYTAQSWTMPQKKWLDRLAKQLVHEVVLDRQFVNHRFADDGGAKHLDKILNNQLDHLISSLNDALWQIPNLA